MPAAHTSDAQAHLGPVQKRIDLLGHVALVLVWLTGVLLVWNLYGGVGEFGMLFWFKIAAVGAVTVAVLAMDREARRAGRERRMPAEGAMAGFGMLATAPTVAAIVLAVYAFGG